MDKAIGVQAAITYLDKKSRERQYKEDLLEWRMLACLFGIALMGIVVHLIKH